MDKSAEGGKGKGKGEAKEKDVEKGNKGKGQWRREQSSFATLWVVSDCIDVYSGLLW